MKTENIAEKLLKIKNKSTETDLTLLEVDYYG